MARTRNDGKQSWYLKNGELMRQLCAGESLPGAFVDLGAFDQNILTIDNAVSPNKSIRVATKSIRVPALLERIKNKSHRVKGWMTYSALETEFLAKMGFDDFLLAYPTAQKNDIEAIRRVACSGKKIAVVVDSVAGLEALSKGFEASQPDSYLGFSVILDLDCSLDLGFARIGVERSPLRRVRDVVELAKTIQSKYSRIKIGGIMAYEAVAAGVGDRNPFFKMRNLLLKPLRRLACKQAQNLRFEVVQGLKKAGIDCAIVNGGGTGDVNWVGEEAVLTEVTVGSGYLCGHLFGYYSNLNLESALVLGLPVVRKPTQKVVTVLGGGFVASGVPGWDRLPRPVDGQNLNYLSAEGAGEVQTPFANLGRDLGVGDVVFVRPAKSGEIAERFHSYALTRSNAVVDRVKTYRGHGACFF